MIVLISYRRRLIPVITSITEARSYITRPQDYAGIAKADRAVIDSVPADREQWLSLFASELRRRLAWRLMRLFTICLLWAA